MSNYKFYTKPKNTLATSSIPGRSKEMKKNLAGGVSFKAEDFVALRRWMLTGSTNNSFYQNKETMTKKNVKLLTKCVEKNAIKVAEEIIYASNKGINNHTPLLALVYLSMGDFGAKKKFREIFGTIVRTASHLYEFVSYVKALRGFGKTIHKAVNKWLADKDAKELEYQFLKYQQRDGWSAKDVLRLMKPKTKDTAKNLVYKWTVGKVEPLNSMKELSNAELMRLLNYERMKNYGGSDHMNEKTVIGFINDWNLTHEMIPSNIERTTAIWEALFKKMPVTATIRNLGNLTNKGVFDNVSNLDILEKRFSKEILSRGRVHPLNIANAYKVYQQGKGFRGSLTWKVIPRVCDILEEAIENAFDCIEPTGKVFYHALDISGSMIGGFMSNRQVGNLLLNPMEVEGVMTLASIRSEKNYFVGGFSNNFVPLSNIRSKGCSFKQIVNRSIFDGLRFGGTNAGSAFEYATENKIYTDVFVLWTDNENWLSYQPSQKLAEYREKVNPKAKAIYVTLCPNGDLTSLVDPKDSLSYDIAGFSSDTIKLIQLIANGDI